MPLLSIPLIALGAKFATTVTCLPIISSGEKLSAIPETMVLISMPKSTVSFNNFLVLATFSASKMVPIRKSNLLKSLNSMISF